MLSQGMERRQAKRGGMALGRSTLGSSYSIMGGRSSIEYMRTGKDNS